MNDYFKEHKGKWEKLGIEQPYWSVITQPEYRPEKLAKEGKSKFFESGKSSVQKLHNFCDKAGVRYQKSSCLDFGCGLGRVTFQLAKEFDHVIGVDISKNHISIAQNKKTEFRLNNIEFVVLENGVDDIPNMSFDLIFSMIVLQHIRKKEVFRIFTRFIELTKDDGGMIFFQIPTFHPKYDFEVGRLKNEEVNGEVKFSISGWLRRVFKSPSKPIKLPSDEYIEMHAIRQKHIINYFLERGCRLEGCFEDNMCGKDWVSNWFIFRK